VYFFFFLVAIIFPKSGRTIGATLSRLIESSLRIPAPIISQSRPIAANLVGVVESDTLGNMSRKRAFTWSIAGMLIGAVLLVFLLYKVPPFTTDGQIDLVVIAAFLLTSMVLISGVAAFVLLVLHRRWPALAGVLNGKPEPFAAIRQGLLVSATAGVLAVLGLLQMLDIAFVLGAILIAGLIEAYMQSRKANSKK